jgi:hypothetical protein
MTIHHAARISAQIDPATARSLHLISLIRGRLDALEAAIAGQDARTRLRVLVEASEMFDELLALASETTRERAA